MTNKIPQPDKPLTAKQHEELARNQIAHWRMVPLDFVQDVFGFKPSMQQRDLLEELRLMVAAKMKVDIGEELTEEELVYSKKRGISIRSGKGTGKDAIVSLVIYWFLFCFTDSKTFMVAPSLANIKSNLIAEMNKWKSRRIEGEPVCILRDEFHLLTTGCRLSADVDKGKNWFVSSVTAGPNLPEEKQLEALQGKHARFMMFVIDEASGVPDPVFMPLDTTLTDPVNFIIMIFNPTRRSGFAHETHFGPEKKHWISLHWDAEESEMVSEDQLAYMREKYGEQSSEYRVSVKGIPPSAEDGSLVPYDWCIDARDQEFELFDEDAVIFGVDVANMGKDSSVILVRKGRSVVEITEYKKANTIELAEFVAMRAAEWEPDAIYVDTAGIGIGVYDNLKEMKVPKIHAINVGKQARRPQKFMRLRDELWWAVRTAFENNEISLFHVAKDKCLISEVSSIKYEINDKSKVKVEGKIQMRQRGMPSPNKGDALMLTYCSNIIALRQGRKASSEHRKQSSKRYGSKKTDNSLNWLNC